MTWGPDATKELARLAPDGWKELQKLFPDIKLVPLFDKISRSTMEQLIKRGQRLTPGYQPGPFFETFRLKLPPKALWTNGAPVGEGIGPALSKLLRRHLPPIDLLTVKEIIPPLPTVSDGAVSDTTPDLPYLHPAPEGIDAKAAWWEAGGSGANEAFADVERGWKTDHVEFTGFPVVVLPESKNDEANVHAYIPAPVPHGTSVLAVVAARKNGQFGMGVAYEADHAWLASEYRVTGDDNLAEAITEATLKLADEALGSVLLIEMQTEVSEIVSAVAAHIDGPVEVDPVIYELIRLAVANHVIVVEAAGNGGYGDKAGTALDIGDYPPPVGSGSSILVGDSGAIIVGQSFWTDPWRGAAGFHTAVGSVVGRRIDCFAWGDKVYSGSAVEITGGTTKYADAYNPAFNGTSAASAIIAGAAIVVQGMMRALATTPPYLNPMQMRAVLGDRTAGVNTPLPGGVTDVIGVMPDLGTMLARLKDLPDLYIRDSVSDTGAPHTGPVGLSPDIIVRTTPLAAATPDGEFGEGSGFEDADDLGDPLVELQPAEVYVRVRNRGGSGVSGATVTAYYADSGTILQPWQWTPIGLPLVVDIPAGDTIVVAGPIAWASVPAAGHYCFIATVDHPIDKVFARPALADWAAFKDYMRVENNLAYRNFDVAAMPESSAIAPFSTNVSGPQEGGEEETELLVEAKLPAGATLEVELPEKLAKTMTLPEEVFKSAEEGKPRRGRLSLHGQTRLGSARLGRRALHRVTLHVKIPPELRNKKYELALIQRQGQQELGRVAWRLVPPTAHED